jgi:hypothetical protein
LDWPDGIGQDLQDKDRTESYPSILSIMLILSKIRPAVAKQWCDLVRLAWTALAGKICRSCVDYHIFYFFPTGINRY